MKKITEEMNVQMHKYGISEWKEKSCILSEEERKEVLKDLLRGTPSTLSAIVKLPFPQFANMYFKRLYPKHPLRETYLRDPEFGYKLYFLTHKCLEFFSEMLRRPDAYLYSIAEDLGYAGFNTQVSRRIVTIMNRRLEELPKELSSVKNPSKMTECKFAYLTQYINLEEAKRMNLSLVHHFEQEGSNGYEFEKKLDSLNTVARIIITEYIGLNGKDPKSISDIAKETGLSKEMVRKIIEILFPSMTKTLGEFRNKIGYIEENQLEGSAKEYLNKQYRELDIKAEITYIKKHVISDSEKEILTQSELSASEMTIYLARKYMYVSAEQVVRNLSIAPCAITTVMNKKSL